MRACSVRIVPHSPFRFLSLGFLSLFRPAISRRGLQIRRFRVKGSAYPRRRSDGARTEEGLEDSVVEEERGEG
uniref:Uncharacterized protein n=1 Tax=Setaria viridis TaxID=4556 RepID=A0A4U6UWH4_SETVI|nr:hypothetical protein SEVIR_4G046601v2 [Setaria viridis]